MRIRVHPAFGLYFAVIALIAPRWTCLSALCALAVHEAAHWAAGRALGERATDLELTPFGGVMRYAPERAACKGLRGAAIAAAGPLANYAMLLLLPHCPAQVDWVHALLRQMLLANAAMLLLNLLPALPLDGGRVVLSLGYYAVGLSRLIAALTAAGVGVGAALLGLGLYGATALHTVNLSLFIVGAYLIACAVRSRGCLLAENLCAVVQERLSDAPATARAQLYCVDAQTPLCALLSLLPRCEAAIFVGKGEADALRLIPERRVLRAMLHDAGGTFGQLVAEEAARASRKTEGKSG